MDSRQSKDKGRKQRSGFNVKKDLMLLWSVLQHNPWQLGDGKWNCVVEDCNKAYDVPVVVRTVKKRLELLLEKFNAQQLLTLTGTEEERTERGILLEEILSIIEEEKVKINTNIGAEDDIIEDLLFSEDEFRQAGQVPVNTKRNNVVAQTRVERQQADKERDNLLSSAPSPITSRKKRKMSIEDEMIKERQIHEMEMEKERLQLERDKLMLEEKREERMKDGGKRRDELAAIQIQIQTQLLNVLSKFIEKS